MPRVTPSSPGIRCLFGSFLGGVSVFAFSYYLFLAFTFFSRFFSVLLPIAMLLSTSSAPPGLH